MRDETTMSIAEMTVESLPDLVETVLRIDEGVPEDCFLWFRGAGCSAHELLPRLMRDAQTGEKVFERESRLLTRFRQRSMPYWFEGYPQSDWEHLFAMQHYGVPTRLLDWSENVFVAAHFALSVETRGHESHEGECRPSIYCLDPVSWNRKAPPLSEYGEATHVLTTVDQDADAYRPLTDRKRTTTPVAIFGSHNSERIVAQRGTFVVWGRETRSMQDFADDLGDSLLWRIELEGDRLETLRHLRALGFSETMVFPELPSLAQELTRLEGWR
jgi:hypothetical protein